MDNSIYIALSKQAVQFRKMAVVANNVANLNTPSFKQDVMMLTEWDHPDVNRQKDAFVQDLRMYRKHEPGPIQKTGNPLDLAIQGDGFFSVQTPRGVRYTRAGNLQLDPTGTLVTSDGFPVQNPGGGAIIIPPETKEITVNEEGVVYVDEEELDQINLVSFANVQKLQREGGMLYNAVEAPIPGGNFRLMQGFLEGSNVQSVVELTDMIETSRSVGRTAQFMDTAYELQRRAMNAWAQSGNQ